MENIDDLLIKLETRNWQDEVKVVYEIYCRLHKPTLTELAEIIKRPLSWVSISIQLAQGLNKYPGLDERENRNQAYKFLQKKKMLRRLSES